MENKSSNYKQLMPIQEHDFMMNKLKQIFDLQYNPFDTRRLHRAIMPPIIKSSRNISGETLNSKHRISYKPTGETATRL